MSSIEDYLSSKIVIYQWLSSVKGHLQLKVVFHKNLSSIHKFSTTLRSDVGGTKHAVQVHTNKPSLRAQLAQELKTVLVIHLKSWRKQELEWNFISSSKRVSVTVKGSFDRFLILLAEFSYFKDFWLFKNNLETNGQWNFLETILKHDKRCYWCF